MVEDQHDEAGLIRALTRAGARVVPHEGERFVDEHSTLEAIQMNPGWRWHARLSRRWGMAQTSEPALEAIRDEPWAHPIGVFPPAIPARSDRRRQGLPRGVNGDIPRVPPSPR
jgi:hypothetical protein